jgi:hypothetical protein
MTTHTKLIFQVCLNATFNIVDLTVFNTGFDWRLNTFEERGDDVNHPTNTGKDPLHVPNGPMTRSKTKTLKEALNVLVLKVSTKSDLKGPLEYQKKAVVHLIHVQEEPIQLSFSHEVRRKYNKGNKRILHQLGNNMGWLPFPLVFRINGLHGRL